jgi:uncharacterized protein YbbC (DUF1343 family)
MHNSEYNPPVSPSPNLPNKQAIRLYPSLAFFEGTVVSEGRGTPFPFQVFGFPGFSGGDLTFTPESKPGASTHPKFENSVCTGKDLRGFRPGNGKWDTIHLEWLIEAYKAYPDKAIFFLPYFDKLAGTDQLRKDIQNGLNASQIRIKWKADLVKFSEMRGKYLLYE